MVWVDVSWCGLDVGAGVDVDVDLVWFDVMWIGLMCCWFDLLWVGLIWIYCWCEFDVGLIWCALMWLDLNWFDVDDDFLCWV